MRPTFLFVCLLAPLVFLPAQTRIEIDAAKRYQTIEGFGTCLVSWGKYPEQTYTKSFADFYAGEVGLNMLREALDGWDHPEVSSPQDISWQKIDITSRGAVFVDFAKKLKQRDPEVRIIGTVWTPPAWMKVNKSDNNGSKNRQNRAIRAQSYGNDTNRVDPDKYEHFVQWLVAIAEWHKQNGIPMYAISPANEPRFSQWYGSCVWTAEDLATVVGMLGEALEKAGLGDILIYGPEDMTGHNYDGGTRTMVKALMDDPDARKHLDRFATHGYTDGVIADTTQDSSARFWELIKPYEKAYWMTEGGTKGHQWPEPVTNGVAQAIHNSLVGGNASAFVPWQISESGPSTHALAVKDTATKKTYATMHYSRSIPVDARRIDTHPAFGKIQTSAFFHPETRDLAIILLNPGKQDEPVTLELKNLEGLKQVLARRTSATEDFTPLPPVTVTGNLISLTLPGESIVSLTGAGGGHLFPAISEPRNWTNLKGESVLAALVAYNGQEIIIRRKGIDYRLHVDQLSEKDRDWLEKNQTPTP